MQYQRLIVENDNVGERLDRFLTNAGVWPSRSFVQKIIDAQGVTRNGKPLKASYRLEYGDIIEVTWDEPKPLEVTAEAIPIDILYEDQDVIVVNKPRGMVVHPAAGNYERTLVNALLNHCTDLSGIGGIIRPGIVHRLDKDTSGVLVVAKNDLAHIALTNQLKARQMNRIYQTIVHGRPKESGRIEGPIGRHPIQRKKMAVVANGKPAVTNYRVLEYFKQYSFLEVKLETGRTHQIRVHLSHIGYPVVGDPVYGRKKEVVPIEGQALHAAVLGFIHPRTGDYLEFRTELPSAVQQALEWCRKH
ncbi:MAG TPA: RluA family pseudouridine synthase [Bacillota bacterium]|nr:RluA family pseudouridine synthase [Bacillota bacterium]HOL10283.1 RluA family pseudouridine synthase [Bacillota bacterium]HPO97401.1 RluA family pseudouridine synthase [Bacillota bacterium]